MKLRFAAFVCIIKHRCVGFFKGYRQIVITFVVTESHLICKANSEQFLLTCASLKCVKTEPHF